MTASRAVRRSRSPHVPRVIQATTGHTGSIFFQDSGLLQQIEGRFGAFQGMRALLRRSRDPRGEFRSACCGASMIALLGPHFSVFKIAPTRAMSSEGRNPPPSPVEFQTAPADRRCVAAISTPYLTHECEPPRISRGCILTTRLQDAPPARPSGAKPRNRGRPEASAGSSRARDRPG